MSPTGGTPPAPEPGRAQAAYRRLRRATGVADLPGLEQRVSRLEVGVREEMGLHRPLAEVVGRLEEDLVPLLERRARWIARAEGDRGHTPEK